MHPHESAASSAEMSGVRVVPVENIHIDQNGKILCTNTRRLTCLQVLASKDSNRSKDPVRSSRIHICQHNLDRSRTTTHIQNRE